MREVSPNDEGALQSLTEPLDGPPEPEVKPEPAPVPATTPAPVATTQGEPGLPSPHQNHSKNWVERAQIDWQTFRAGHDALVAELNGLDAAHDAAQTKRQSEFDAENNRISQEHDLKRDELLNRINDMLDGMDVTEHAVQRYGERLKERADTIIDEDERQE